mgnify:CR=1 FL=1
MNILIVHAHPYDGSFSKGILDRTLNLLAQHDNVNIKVKDLCKMDFDFVMRAENLQSSVTGIFTKEVKAEQDDILWAETLITICPVWFGSVPGFMKAYFDKIFVRGFGYDSQGGRIRGKRIFSIFNFGSIDPYVSMVNQYTMIDYQWDNLFGMVGFSDIVKLHFTGVPKSTDEVRANYLLQVDDFLEKIFSTKVGDIGTAGNADLITRLAANGYLNGKPLV